MKKSRRKFPAEFEAKFSIEEIKEIKTISEFADGFHTVNGCDTKSFIMNTTFIGVF